MEMAPFLPSRAFPAVAEERTGALTTTFRFTHLSHQSFDASVIHQHYSTKAPERHFKCTMRLATPAPDLYAEDYEPYLYAAIDMVAKKIEQQIRKRHNKYKARKHK